MSIKTAGASVITLPSNEIYAAMQTGAMDAAMTSSTSFISFKLEEIAKHLTSGRQRTYWFMFEPLMISKEVFSKLPKASFCAKPLSKSATSCLPAVAFHTAASPKKLPSAALSASNWLLAFKRTAASL